MTVEITASGSTLEREAIQLEVEVPDEIAGDEVALNEFINSYLDENEAGVKEWVLSDIQQEQDNEFEEIEEEELPF